MRNKFKISIASMVAGFLIFSGFQSLIAISRDPLVRVVIKGFNSFLHAKELTLRPAQYDWVLMAANIGLGLFTITLGVVIAAFRKRAQAPVGA